MTLYQIFNVLNEGEDVSNTSVELTREQQIEYVRRYREKYVNGIH